MNLDIKNRSKPYFILGAIFTFLWVIIFIAFCATFALYLDIAATILFFLLIAIGIASALLFIVGAHEHTKYKNNLEKWKIEENKKLKYQQSNLPIQKNEKIREDKIKEFNLKKNDLKTKELQKKDTLKVDKEIITNCEKICNNDWKCMQECITFSLKFKNNLNMEDYKYDEEKRN